VLFEESYTLPTLTNNTNNQDNSNMIVLATLKSLLGFGLLGGHRREAARNEDVEAAWNLAQADVPSSCAPVSAPTAVRAEITPDPSLFPQHSLPDKALPSCPCGRGGQARSMVSRGTSPDIPDTDDHSHEDSTTNDASSTTVVASDDEPADDDARREATYSCFEGEDETDYTAGPVRIVEASDGVKPDCGALLLNLDFTSKIKTAVEAERELASANLKAKAQIQECSDFEHELKSRTGKHEYGLALAEQEAEEDDKKIAEVRALHAELEKLNSLLEETVAEREDVAANISMRADELIQLQMQVNCYLEEAFVVANLLNPADALGEPSVSPRDVEEEYKKLCEKTDAQSDDDNDNDYALHSFEDHFKPRPLSDEEQKEKELQDAYDEAKSSLRDAQNQFEKRELYRETDRCENEWTLQQSRGAESVAWEEFDVLWVQKISELTRELIDAEAAFAAARRAAAEAGVEIDDADQSSEFGIEDGVYPPSVDEQLIAFVPRARVEAWLDAIPDSTPGADFEAARSDVEVDEWAADEVEVGDSYSTVAEPEEKRKIRKWQRACGNGRAA